MFPKVAAKIGEGFTREFVWILSCGFVDRALLFPRMIHETTLIILINQAYFSSSAKAPSAPNPYEKGAALLILRGDNVIVRLPRG